MRIVPDFQMSDTDSVEPIGKGGISGTYASGECQGVERMSWTAFVTVEHILHKADLGVGRREARIDLDRSLERDNCPLVLLLYP